MEQSQERGRPCIFIRLFLTYKYVTYAYVYIFQFKTPSLSLQLWKDSRTVCPLTPTPRCKVWREENHSHPTAAQPQLPHCVHSMSPQGCCDMSMVLLLGL